MFVVVQFPLADIRSFLPCDTSRIPLPSWPLLRQTEFLRFSGPARHRYSGGVQDWQGEEAYCSSARALRLPALEKQRLSSDSLVLKPIGRFRRFFFDGTAIARAEVAFRLIPADDHSVRPLRAEEVFPLLQQLLAIPVSVPTSQDRHDQTPLLNADRLLAQLFLAASTKRGATFENWWVSSGEPQIVVEFTPRNAIPPHARGFPLPGHDVELWHGWFQHLGRQLGVWFLRADHDSSFYPDRNSRYLRISLLRWHAEKECLKEVIRALARGRLPITPEHDSTERLQAFLNAAIKRVSRTNESNLPRHVLTDFAWRADDLVMKGEAVTLVAELQKFRRQVATKVKTFIAEQALRASGVAQRGGESYITNVIMGGEMVKIQNIGPGANVGTNVQADTIQNSFNILREAAITDELRRSLENLTTLVGQLSPQLDPAKAQQVSQDLQLLVGEAVKEVPRRKWYELSAEGLLDAAKGVAGLVEPITKAVTAVLALLGG